MPSYETKIFRFGKFSVPFVRFPDGRWVTSARILGRVLQYSKRGQRFIGMLKLWEFVPTEDYQEVSPEELEELRSNYPEFGTRAFGQPITLITIKGIAKALLRCSKKVAITFRIELLENANELLTDDIRQQLAVKEEQTKLPLGKKLNKRSSYLNTTSSNYQSDPPLPEKVSTALKVIDELRLTGLFSDEEIKKMYEVIWRNVMPIEKGISTETAPKEVDAIKEPEAVQVPLNSSIVVVTNPDPIPVARVPIYPQYNAVDREPWFFLCGNQKHPNFPDWVSASEIAKVVGMTSNQIKDDCAKYARSFNGKDLSNNFASKLIQTSGGGAVNGVTSLADPLGIPVYIDMEIGCLAVWYMQSEGKIVWRNYWSPHAANTILRMVGQRKDKK